MLSHVGPLVFAVSAIPCLFKYLKFVQKDAKKYIFSNYLAHFYLDNLFFSLLDKQVQYKLID